MRFPDCTIHRMEQRSPEWHEIRKGKLTGSQFGVWLAERPECRFTVAEIRQQIAELVGEEPPKNLTRPQLLDECDQLGLQLPKTFTKKTEDARKEAIYDIIGQVSTCQVPDEYEVDPDGPPPRNKALWSIWNGMIQEPKAVAAFEFATGLEIEEAGFCEHRSGKIGVSPDGLIKGQNVGFEGKAPLPKTHAKYFLSEGLPEEYKAQVHGCMAVTGADAWWFQSYCPGLPTFRILVERDAFTEAIKEGLDLFVEELKKQSLRAAEKSELEAKQLARKEDA